MAIYLKSVFPPFDSNIKFYNAPLYSSKNVEIKTSFYQKNGLGKKDAPEYTYMSWIFFN